MLLPGKALRKDISRLVVSGHVIKGDIARLDLVSEEVIADVDVFRSVMELWVFRDGDGRLVVDEEGNRE